MNNINAQQLSTAEILKRWRNFPTIGEDEYRSDLDSYLDSEISDPFTRAAIHEEPRN